MKLVTFSRAQAPHGVGDTRLVTDEVAAQLGREDLISDAQPWPPAPAAPPASRIPSRPMGGPKRPAPGKIDQRIAR